ncbi:TonB-dependent receptor [Kordiimonas pumila]|uniref:TonB-dependent receptor n=1 Tax=Kordiimonas pumila TaxID=2161677 RepID=A0ABV7D6H5_9PROT|nr:TonB-dependent receptor [Kordiimonas pumila]
MKSKSASSIRSIRLMAGIAVVAVQAGAFISAPVQAQAKANKADMVLEEIIVTAEKRSENLQETPIAISAVTSDDIRNMNIESLLDVGSFVPNVLVGSQTLTGSNSGGFYIRGIGQDRSGITFDQGVGLYVDGVFMSRSDSSLLSILDVERIEVLRGPQGTLFGKNTIGGAIQYITKQPTGELGGYVDATVGSFDRLDIKAGINIPLTEKLFAKVTVGSLERKGFIEHIADNRPDGDDNTQIGRLQLRALVSDTITVDLSASKTKSHNNGRAYIVDFIDPSDLFISVHNAKTGEIYDERYVSPDSYTRYGGDESGYDYDGFALSGVVTAELSETFTVKSISSYMEADVYSANDWDGTGFNVYDIVNNRKIDQFSQELQLEGTLGDLQFVTGLYYLKETPTDDSEITTAFDGTYPVPRSVYQRQTVESYAAFAQGTYNVTDNFSVTAGIRYSKDKKSGVGGRINTGFEGTGEGSWDNFSPRLTLEYQWTPDVMTYASVTKGFRSGGINVGDRGAPIFTQYDPETVWNYEAGIRSDLFDNRVRLNLTGFHMEYTDQQLTALEPISLATYIQNVGDSHRTGFEAEAWAVVTENLKLRGTFGYINAKYDDVGTATGITVDSRVFRTPEFTYSVGATYEADVGEGSMLASVNYDYRAKQGTTSTDANSVLLDGYGLMSARLQYTSKDEVWSLALAATNLLDKEYFIGGMDFARVESVIGVSMLDVGRPREISVNLLYNF